MKFRKIGETVVEEKVFIDRNGHFDIESSVRSRINSLNIQNRRTVGYDEGMEIMKRLLKKGFMVA